MNTRLFYFLMDGLTGEYYTGQNNWMGDLSDAAVYYSHESARKKFKDIIRAWQHDKQYGSPKDRRDCIAREGMENYGIQIIEGAVTL